jgi:hypothetical protein
VGVSSGVPRGKGRKRERGGRDRQPDREARMALGGVVRGSIVRSRRRRAGEQGRAAGRGRHGAAWLTDGAERQRGPMSAAGCGRERGKRGSTAAGGAV